MRPEVKRFADSVEARLDEFQARKGNSWRSLKWNNLADSIKGAVKRLFHLTQVDKAWFDGRVRQQGIDVGAWALFISEHANGIDPEPGYTDGVFVDIDGTLTEAGTDKLLPGVVEAINKIYDSGQQVWLWTARPLTLNWIKPLIDAGLKFHGVQHKPLMRSFRVFDDRFAGGQTTVPINEPIKDSVTIPAAALRAAREALEEAVEHHCGCVEEYMIGDTKIPAHTCTYCVALAALGGEAKP